jgi:hypothetical protein
LLLVLATSVAVALLRLWQPFADWIERQDVYLVVPDWKFFAPTPNRSDYHLVLRQRQLGRQATAWAPLMSSRRTSLRPRLWDPDRRVRKAVVDVSAHYLVLSQHRREEEAPELRPTIATSMVYLLLLNMASGAAPGPGDVQFALVVTRNDPDDPGEIAVLSDFHPVER